MAGTGYVNRGTDPRVDGPIGRFLGALQRKLSFYSPNSPYTVITPLDGGGHISISWPLFFSLFIAKGGGRYFSFRAGWRHDPNWGDGNNPNEPAHDPPGGYIADVILKTNIDNVVVNG